MVFLLSSTARGSVHVSVRFRGEGLEDRTFAYGHYLHVQTRSRKGPARKLSARDLLPATATAADVKHR
eukprot:3361112-Pleurochrysis_carterae.AAC.1